MVNSSVIAFWPFSPQTMNRHCAGTYSTDTDTVLLQYAGSETDFNSEVCSHPYTLQ